MMNTKKLTLKILAGVLAAALIAAMLFITNSFVGNPVSTMMANRAIQKYVEQKYSAMNLEIEKASYNFKEGGYMARAKSKTSIDTRFNIYYSKGKIKRDDYETYVLGKFNTLQRFSEEYSAIAKDILAKELGYKNNTTMVIFDKDEYEKYKDILELDMKFDKALPVNMEVTIRLDLQDNSSEGMAKVMSDAYKAFAANGCNFSKYSLYSEYNGVTVMVTGVAVGDIESGKLASLLEKAKGNSGVNGISVYIKEAKK